MDDCIKAVIKHIVRKRAFLHIYNSANRDVFEAFLWDACGYCVSRDLHTLVERFRNDGNGGRFVP